MSELTDRQREVLRYLCTQLVKEQRVPTLREIGDRFGIRSTNGVSDTLKAIAKKGHIMIDPLLSRGIRILRDEDGRAPVIEFRFGARP